MNYAAQVRERKEIELSDKQVVHRLLASRTALEKIMADVAEGAKVTHIAEAMNVSYEALYAVLNSKQYKERYQAARNAYAEYLAEQNLDVADKIESLHLPADAGKAAAGIRQWYIERTNPDRFGQKSSVNVTHKGVVGLHLEAIRELSREPLDGEFEEAEDADYTPVDDLDDHPLL